MHAGKLLFGFQRLVRGSTQPSVFNFHVARLTILGERIAAGCAALASHLGWIIEAVGMNKHEPLLGSQLANFKGKLARKVVEIDKKGFHGYATLKGVRNDTRKVVIPQRKSLKCRAPNCSQCWVNFSAQLVISNQKQSHFGPSWQCRWQLTTEQVVVHFKTIAVDPRQILGKGSIQGVLGHIERLNLSETSKTIRQWTDETIRF
mmetsp:Transcript_2343/g.4751  ORF Transcript_2343/g.4751 Transcript_2343/m.4751 type:complete len:204 (+) Transcript_2343:433-1044(+)